MSNSDSGTLAPPPGRIPRAHGFLIRCGSILSHYFWPVAIIGTLVIVLEPLFRPGAIYVGDYVSTPTINPYSQFQQSFSSFIFNVRNAGYGPTTIQFRWALSAYSLLETIPAYLTSNSTYAKLLAPILLGLGSLGLYAVIVRLFNARGRTGPISRAVATIFALFYSLNPGTLQLFVKGYWDDLLVLALLPWLLLTYEWLIASSTVRQFIPRAVIVSSLIFVGLDYTYALAEFIVVIVAVELFSTRTTLFHNGLAGVAARVGTLGLLCGVWEVPTAYIVVNSASFAISPQNTLSSASYLSVNQNVSMFTALTMTSSMENVPEYFHSIFPAFYSVYIVALIITLVLTFLLLFMRSRWDRETKRNVTLFAIALVVASGPTVALNVYLFQAAPYLLEAQEMLPLVGFSLCLLACDAIATPSLPLEEAPATQTQSSRFKVTKHRIPPIAAGACIGFVVVCVVASSIPFASATQSQASPVSIPGYDTAAYNWLASQPGDGRMLLIPPSYSVTYPFNSGGYSGPVDYWTISPPKPIVIVSDGTLGSYYKILPQAIYQGNSPLLAYLLTSLGVEYVVLRGDAVSTWNVPYFSEINESFVSEHFTFLDLAATFGPIAIWLNPDYDGLFQAYAYPVVAESNTSILTAVSDTISPGAPVVYTQNQSAGSVMALATSFDAPVLIPCPDTPCGPPAGEASFSQPLYVLDQSGSKQVALSDPGLPYAEFAISAGSAFSAHSTRPTGTLFDDNFTSEKYTRSHWSVISGNWTTGNGQVTLLANPYAEILPNLTGYIGNTVTSVNLELSSGTGGGPAGGVFITTWASKYSGYNIVAHPTWGSGAIQVIKVTNGIGTTAATINFPMGYNDPLRFSISLLNTTTFVFVNGQQVFSVQTNQTNRVVGLWASNAVVSYSNYTVQSVLDVPLNYSLLQSHDALRSALVPIPASGFLYFTSSTNFSGTFLSQVAEDPVKSLSPPKVGFTLAPLGGWGDWQISVNSSELTFFVARYIDFPGWASTGSCVTVYQFGVGCEILRSGSLTWQSSYTWLAEGTGVAFVTSALFSAFLVTWDHVSLIRRKTEKRSRVVVIER
jgi:hypothetical protein